AFHLAVAAERHAAGQRQVAVEPGCQQSTAVDFHAQLQEALALQFRLWLDAQARAVGMRADQAQAAVQGQALAELERNQRGIVAGYVVTAASFAVPRLALIKRFETGRFEALGKGGGGVERGGRSLEEVDQTLIELSVHKGLQTAMGGVYRICAAVAGGKCSTRRWAWCFGPLNLSPGLPRDCLPRPRLVGQPHPSAGVGPSPPASFPVRSGWCAAW